MAEEQVSRERFEELASRPEDYVFRRSLVREIIAYANQEYLRAARAEVQVQSGDELLREVLEAMCRKQGISTMSENYPEQPARNFQLVLRLGIGEVFGLEQTDG